MHTLFSPFNGELTDGITIHMTKEVLENASVVDVEVRNYVLVL